MNVVLPSCASCCYAEPTVLDDGPAVDCRRFPPQVIDDNGQPMQAWPQMRAEDWCGEWKPKGEA